MEVWIYLALAVIATVVSWLPRLSQSAFLRVLATVLCMAAGAVLWMNLYFWGSILIMIGILQGSTVDALIDSEMERREAAKKG